MGSDKAVVLSQSSKTSTQKQDDEDENYEMMLLSKSEVSTKSIRSQRKRRRGWQVTISKSKKPEKRLQADFAGKKVTHFGQKGGSTFVDHRDNQKKEAWLARHKVNEDWRDLQSAGALARHLLWSQKTLAASVAALNQRQKKYKFKLK